MLLHIYTEIDEGRACTHMISLYSPNTTVKYETEAGGVKLKKSTDFQEAKKDLEHCFPTYST